jgi:hypothetical protein
MTGGVLAAALADDSMSTVALMGLLAVLALAVRGGILQLGRYRDLEREGGIDAAVVVLGARQRFGPTVTAALATALALAPLLVWEAAPASRSPGRWPRSSWAAWPPPCWSTCSSFPSSTCGSAAAGRAPLGSRHAPPPGPRPSDPTRQPGKQDRR